MKATEYICTNHKQNIQRLLDAEEVLPDEKNIEVIRHYITYLENSLEELVKIIDKHIDLWHHLGR